MRIRHPAAKFGVVMIGIVLAIMIPIAIQFFTGSQPMAIGGILALTIVLVVVCVRTFRGPSEGNEPRAWWRLTEKPTAGYIVTAWFVLQALTWGVPPLWGESRFDPGVVAMSVVVYVILAAAFATSSTRLMMLPRV